jgi:superfamily I DNA/RNA helicase
MNELILMTPADAFDPRAQAVALMTLHMAKGLEFKIVFITGCEEGVTPFTLLHDDADIEEERRLFYVGMTRARDELYLLQTRSRFLYGQKLSGEPSRFVSEIPQDLIRAQTLADKPKQKKARQESLF